jgi:hypothetical protein
LTSPAAARRAGRSSAPPATPSARGAEDGPAPSASLSQARSAVSTDDLEMLLRVAELVRSIRFGNVVITVQDRVVVQIETAEKFRLR